eukprot:COSAG02_NODE_19448_length_881_cov_1.575448_1_plen_84_part_00
MRLCGGGALEENGPLALQGRRGRRRGRRRRGRWELSGTGDRWTGCVELGLASALCGPERGAGAQEFVRTRVGRVERRGVADRG